jgi:hypothetical protein
MVHSIYHNNQDNVKMLNYFEHDPKITQGIFLKY